MPPSEWPGGFPGVEAAVELLEREAPDDRRCGRQVRERVAVVTAMLDGWVLIEDQLLEIVGLTPHDREHARETVLAVVREILAPLVRRRIDTEVGAGLG